MSRQELQEEKMIQEVLEYFDFQKCRKVMLQLNWTWGITGRVPTTEDLKVSAKERLKNAIKVAKESKNSNVTYFSSSGGLKGNAWVNRYGHIEGVKLEFVLTEWDSDGDV